MVKKRVDYEGMVKWINGIGVVSKDHVREEIKSRGHKSHNSVIENMKSVHNLISIRRFKGNSNRYETCFTVNAEWWEENNTWGEHEYGPTEDVKSMVSTLERHGYKEEKEDYQGMPRTYTVRNAGVLGSKVNWCEPWGRSDQDDIPESGAEEELKGCEDSIQQEEAQERGNPVPIKKLYAGIEAQYARDLKTMGKERADWWKA